MHILFMAVVLLVSFVAIEHCISNPAIRSAIGILFCVVICAVVSAFGMEVARVQEINRFARVLPQMFSLLLTTEASEIEGVLERLARDTGDVRTIEALEVYITRLEMGQTGDRNEHAIHGR